MRLCRNRRKIIIAPDATIAGRAIVLLDGQTGLVYVLSDGAFGVNSALLVQGWSANARDFFRADGISLSLGRIPSAFCLVAAGRRELMDKAAGRAGRQEVARQGGPSWRGWPALACAASNN